MINPLKPFFYFKSLEAWEWIVISFYLCLTIWLYSLYLHHAEYRSDILTIYPTVSQLFIICFLYKSLRNLLSYLIWLSFGIFHLFVYIVTKNDTYPNIVGGHASWAFKTTVPLLLLYQILRFVSRKIQLREFVIPSRGGTDLFDDIKPSITDKVIFAVNMIFWFALTYNNLF